MWLILLTNNQVLIAFIIGILIGFLLGIPVGITTEKKNGKNELFVTIVLLLIFMIGTGATINYFFFGGIGMPTIFGLAYGLSFASLIKERNIFIETINAIRGNKHD